MNAQADATTMIWSSTSLQRGEFADNAAHVSADHLLIGPTIDHLSHPPYSE